MADSDLSGNVQASLAAKGLIFNAVDPTSFRAKLRSSGFYSNWKTKFGAEAWGVFESYTGKLA